MLLSVFNIINLVASNVNNNNNRNNINDNSGDLNTADNTESNGMSGGSTATMAMLVPPGVGRRKRDSAATNCNSNQAFLHANETYLSLSHCNQTIFDVHYPFLNDRFMEEIPLGIIMTLNAVNVAEEMTFDSCRARNFCEFGLNCAYFGTGSETVCRIGSTLMSRWLGNNDEDEQSLMSAYKKGTELANCHELFEAQCGVAEWNRHISEIRSNVSTSKCL